MEFFREFAFCVSVNLESEHFTFIVWQDVSKSQINQTGSVKKRGRLAGKQCALTLED